MKRSATITLLLALAMVLLIATGASALSSYAGNGRYPGYGVRADISTPATAPWIGSSGESNWVGTPGPYYWIQTGWRYYYGSAYATSYYEYSLPSGYHLQELSSQSWNMTRTYEVSYTSGGYWAVKIGGVTKGIWGPITAPVAPVQAYSEAWYPTIQLNTQFNNVKYRGTSTWYYFDQNAWVANSPYWLSITSTYRYRTQGP